MSASEGVADWICQLQAGDRQAIQHLWQCYFPRMVELARRQLRSVPRRMADEEDVALDAFHSFCQAVAAGRYSDLQDRQDLWRVLLSLTINKAINLIKHADRDKRTWRRTVSQSDLDAGAPRAGIGNFQRLLETDAPDPASALEVTDRLDWLLEQLNDAQLRRIALLKLEGFTNNEVALQLGCAVSTVERRLHRIRRRLEHHLYGPQGSASALTCG